MPYDRRFALPTSSELAEWVNDVSPECDECPIEECTPTTSNACTHYKKWVGSKEESK